MILRLAQLLLMTALFAAVWSFDGNDDRERNRFTTTTAVLWRGDTVSDSSALQLAGRRSETVVPRHRTARFTAWNRLN